MAGGKGGNGRVGSADGRVPTAQGGPQTQVVRPDAPAPVEAPRPDEPMMAKTPEPDPAPAPEAEPRVMTTLAGAPSAMSEEDAAGPAPSTMQDGPCGGWLVVWEGPARGASYPLRLGSNSVGRDEACHVTIEGDTTVSRGGLSIDYDQHEHRFVLCRHGTQFMPRVGEESVHVSRALEAYDEIRIGQETTVILVPFERRWT